ncbi:O-antigen ligase family protein [Hymenobacter rubidus]|uniref:O-antigen ligase family protein n=1 Tax=Hymenobacter rubidus TaxID=1441626 RepID=UPI00191D95E6|nr:O-antigen ligase family protein [Hymenobacter rubidus]
MSISRFRSRLLLLFYLSLASLPLSVDWFSDRFHLGLMVASEPLMALTVGLTVLGLLGGWLAWPLSSHRLDKLIAFHFGAMFVATVFSSDLLVSAKYFTTLVLYVLFGYCVPRVLVFNRTEWLRAIGALAVGTSLLVAYVLTRHLFMGLSYSISYVVAQPFSKNGHTNLTVLLEPLVLVLNLVLLYHPWAQNVRGRVLVTALLTAVLMVVAFSYSRASYVSLSAQALLLMAYAGWSAGRRLLLPWAVAGVLIFAAWQTLTRIYPNASLVNTHLLHELGTVSDFSATNESNAERLNRWLFSLDLYQQEPVIGVGPGTFPDRYLDFVRHSPNHPTYLTTLRRMNAHNLYLSWLVEAGALGLLSGLMLLGYLVGRQLRWAFRWRPTPLQVGFTVYFLFFLLHSLSQDFWQEPRVVVVFWLAIGLQRYYERPASYSRLAGGAKAAA